MSEFIRLDQTYVEIILRLAEKGTLSRGNIARIIDPNFPYVPRPEKYKLVLKEADKYARTLEKRGLVIKASYKGSDYTLQITEKGEEQAKKFERKSE